MEFHGKSWPEFRESSTPSYGIHDMGLPYGKPVEFPYIPPNFFTFQ